MSLFGFLKDQQLKPTWTYRVDGTIWRVIPAESRKIVGEVRYVAEKATSFFCLNQMTGEVFWEGLKPGEQWWIGIETIHKDVLLLHGFSTPDLPQHKGILAVDLMTGQTLWNNSNLTFVAARENSVFASQESIEGRTFSDLDYRTGEMLRSLKERANIPGLMEAPSAFTAENEIELPAPLANSSDHSMNKYYNADDLVGEVEGVEHRNLLIFNFHEKLAGSSEQRAHLKNTLKVLDKTSGNIIHTTVLNSDTSTVIPESFFIQHDSLFYVRERRELAALHLRDLHGEE